MLANADTVINMCLKSNVENSNYILEDSISKQLGWIQTNDNRCGGYYLEPPIIYPSSLVKSNALQISSDQPFIFSQHGTSSFEGKVTLTRYGQQITASKAFIYRDPKTGKTSAIDLIGDVHLREPNNLVIAQKAHFDNGTHYQSLEDILYRTTIYSNLTFRVPTLSNEALQQFREVTQLSAWGEAKSFTQRSPKIYEFEQVCYSTCPPLTNTWKVKAKQIVINKITGRGTARDAKLYIKNVPILYTPYLSFPIDNRRQTGFLPPTMGRINGDSTFGIPFYWNMAPNYDMTITPLYIHNRGILFTDLFRYITRRTEGVLRVSLIPDDKQFRAFQRAATANAMAGKYGPPNDPAVESNLRHLLNASPTRSSLSWQESTRYNVNWSSHVDFNFVSDDYYLKNFKTNLNQIMTNQLLQEAEANYQDPYWNFIARIQGYQTLHPIDSIQYLNQYGRYPQFVLNGFYPSETGFEYFVNNDFSHFEIRKDRGAPFEKPIGNRIHVQPGISRPINLPSLYFIPRIQLAMTKYELKQIADFNSPNPSRILPIFDISTGLYFDRETNVCGKPYRQTLEPQAYYTLVPYQDQSQIPIFDTSLNTLNYDQLFVYNRFSGLDRIGDANQVSVGIATRLIDQQTGYEKLKAGIGQIYYFKDRRVSLCYGRECVDQPIEPINRENRSPLSATVAYNINPFWNIYSDTIWNPFTKKVDNQNLTLRYHPADNSVINLSYSYVRNNQVFELGRSSINTLQQTDFSMVWPLSRDWSTIGRWTHDWNQNHFLNLFYGLQYDSCCWAVRFVTGRTFIGVSPNRTYQYNTEFFLQFALKGLGNIGSDASQLLNEISGYHNNFGRDF